MFAGRLGRWAVTAVMLAAAGCQDSAPTVEPSPGSNEEVSAASEPSAPTALTEAPDGPVVLLAVGDIASCSTTGDEKVARLLRRRSAPVALLGDVVYPSGTRRQFRQCFDPAWGAMGDRLRPVPGNHEYRTQDAAGYFAYFGDRAGPQGKGWYADDLGEHWRIIALNSECSAVGGCGPRSPQGRWLRRTLDAAEGRHILAYWHVPRFNSGRHGPGRVVAPFWKALHAAGAAIVLNGHEHVYERFAPQNPAGERTRGGIRQFTVGTGGYRHYAFDGPPLPTTQVRNDDSFGVLRLRLGPNGYRWRFLPVTGSFTDDGRHRLDDG